MNYSTGNVIARGKRGHAVGMLEGRRVIVKPLQGRTVIVKPVQGRDPGRRIVPC